MSDNQLSATDSATYSLACSSGYPKLISGGCGFPFYQGSVADSFDILADVYYSGPDPNASDSRWRCAAPNDSASRQTVRIYVNCGR